MVGYNIELISLFFWQLKTETNTVAEKYSNPQETDHPVYLVSAENL
jgi:hypothetical protein